MAKPIVVSIPHSLGRVEAQRRVREGLDKAIPAVANFAQVDQAPWSDDSVSLTIRALGQTASALITVGEDFVRVEGVLPLLLQGFAEKAKTFVEKRGTLLLENRKS